MLVYIDFPGIDKNLVEWLNRRGYVVFLGKNGERYILGVPVRDAEEIAGVLREHFEEKLGMLLSDYESFNEDRELDELYSFMRYNFKQKNYLAMQAAIDTSYLIEEKAYDDFKKIIDVIIELK